VPPSRAEARTPARRRIYREGRADLTPTVSEKLSILSGELAATQHVYKVPGEGLGIHNEVQGIQGRDSLLTR
jgi:hypothetical protein